MDRHSGRWRYPTVQRLSNNGNRQAPLPNTMHTFLSLCTSLTPPHQRVRTIVKLTADVERNVRKGHPYFPTMTGEAHTIRFEPPPPPPDDQTYKAPPAIDVTLLGFEENDDAGCIRSTLRLTLVGVNESFDIQHLYFTAWPDHGIPRDRAPITQFAKLVQKANERRETESGSGLESTSGSVSFPPILAHCSAGVGRTGTFIAISSLLRHLGILKKVSQGIAPAAPPIASVLGEMAKPAREDPVAQEVDGLREQRPWMLQRQEQVLFVYLVLAELLSAT